MFWYSKHTWAVARKLSLLLEILQITPLKNYTKGRLIWYIIRLIRFIYDRMHKINVDMINMEKKISNSIEISQCCQKHNIFSVNLYNI